MLIFFETPQPRRLACEDSLGKKLKDGRYENGSMIR